MSLFKIYVITILSAFIYTNAAAQKITVLTSQVTAETGIENGSKLFDEQTIAGDPKLGSGGACANNWLPGWLNLPHHAYVDLGQNYNITDIYLYDLNGNADFTVETGSPGNWSPLFVDNMATYQTWNAHAVTVNTRYIRFTTADGDCRAYEVVLYGAPGTASTDVIAPSSISNLAVGTITASSIVLSWTSPGDDATIGTAANYDIRYSTSIIANNTDFTNATQAIGEPTPLIAGSIQNFTVTGLTASTQYYFAIKTSDEVPNTSALSNIPNASTIANSGGGLPVLTKTYIHLPSLDPQWTTMPAYTSFAEPSDFDSHWTVLLNTLPAADGSWNGGNINLGSLGTGYGLVNFQGATSSSKKPILVMEPSAGAPPGLGICPSDGRFILCSAMNNSSGTVSSAAEYETAVLAIQQMIRNIQASGNATNDVLVIGKSQGGGLGMMTAGLCPSVKDFFLSVPALSGYNGPGGTNGAFPGYTPTTATAYVDATNHAKRYRNKATFSISYDDNVTWARGQVADSKNTQYETTIYHGNDGHNDSDWWTNGTTWLNGCLTSIVNNGLGLTGTTTAVALINPTNTSLQVFPNPFGDKLTIVLPAETKGSLCLYSIQGALIQKCEINSNTNELIVNEILNKLSDLVAGVYIIELSSVKGVSRSKIIKK